jgi:hypothetical protein
LGANGSVSSGVLSPPRPELALGGPQELLLSRSPRTAPRNTRMLIPSLHPSVRTSSPHIALGRLTGGVFAVVVAGFACDAEQTESSSPTSNSATTEGSTTDTSGTEASLDSGSAELEHFSFFVTSLAALQELSGSEDGFGGDLRYGEADGLTGADKLCTQIAERSMPGSGTKGWRAFLSTTTGGANGGPVHAKDRIGQGPWYDRLGRVVALDLQKLLQTRPEGADPEIAQDLPNEDGVPNHAPDGELVDNHDMLTGTNEKGELFTSDGDALAATCNDWTSAEPSGAPRVGHPWPTGAGGGFGGTGGFPGGGALPPMGFDGGAPEGFLPIGFDGGVPPGAPIGFDGGAPPGGFFGGGPGAIPADGGLPALPGDSFTGGGIGSTDNWMSALTEAGCAPGVFLVEMGPPNASNPTVGSGGGYGGFYCFALQP